jgi:hypothetical protein
MFLDSTTFNRIVNLFMNISNVASFNNQKKDGPVHGRTWMHHLANRTTNLFVNILHPHTHSNVAPFNNQKKDWPFYGHTWMHHLGGKGTTIVPEFATRGTPPSSKCAQVTSSVSVPLQ